MALVINEGMETPHDRPKVSLPTEESTALLMLFNTARLQEKLYVTGQLALQITTGVFFTLQKLHFIRLEKSRPLAKEHNLLLDLVARVQAVEIVGREKEARSLDCHVFPALRKLTVTSLIITGIANVRDVIVLELVQSSIECNLSALATLRTIRFDRSPVPTKQLPSLAYSLRWVAITLNPVEYTSGLWKPPMPDEKIDSLMEWDAVTNVELRGTRVAFQRLDKTWSRLQNLTTLAIVEHGIRSLEQLDILQECVNLRALDVSKNRLHSMAFINNIGPNLIRIVAAFNAIESIEALKDMRFLKHVQLEGNQLTEWCELKDLANGCPQLESIEFSSNPMLNRFDNNKEDILPLAAFVFKFRPLLINGARADSYKGKVQPDFINKHLQLFERYRGDNGDGASSDAGGSTAASGRLRSTSRRTGGGRSRTSAPSESQPRGPRRRKIIRGKVHVDKADEPPRLPESQLDFDDRHQTEFSNRRLDPTQLKEQLGDKWLQQVSAMRTAQRIGASNDRYRRSAPLATTVSALAPSNSTQAAAATQQPQQQLQAPLPPPKPKADSASRRSVALSPSPEATPPAGVPRQRQSAQPTSTAPPPPASQTGASSTSRRQLGTEGGAGSENLRSSRNLTGGGATGTPTSTASSGSPTSTTATTQQQQQQQPAAAAATERVTTPASTSSSRLLNQPSGSGGGGVSSPTASSAPGSVGNRVVRSSAALNESNASKIPRQSPSKPPIPLLQNFLDSLTSFDWSYRENDQKVKAFPSGASIFMSAICEENDKLWGIADPKGDGPTGGGSSSLSKNSANLLDLHSTALEMLIHDSRDGSHNFSDRHYQKTLVRVIEVHSGLTRYIRLETTTVEERGGLPQWNSKPLITVMLDTNTSTPPQDVNFDVVSGESTRQSSRRSANSDRFDSDVFGGGGSADGPTQVNRDFFRVAKPKFIAGFIVQRGHVAQIFIELLKKQLLSCHERLVSAGITMEWPLHLDDTMVSKERDRSVPVKITMAFIQERISKHVDEDVSRQRVGCPVILTGDELPLNVKTYMLEREGKHNFLTMMYANHVDNPYEYHESAVLIVVTTSFILLAHDRNFVGGSSSPDETFRAIQRIAVTLIRTVVVSFNLQSISIELDEETRFIIHTRDAGNTLSLLSAIQQATAPLSIKPDFTIQPCGYPDLTKAPLIFSVALFMRPIGAPLTRRDRETSFPVRHMREVLDPVTLVITSTEIVIMQETDVLTDLHTCLEIVRRPVQAIKAFCVPSKDVFPLAFAIDSNNLAEGRPERWYFAAQHPNTVAYVFAELKGHGKIEVRELSLAEYEGRSSRR